MTDRALTRELTLPAAVGLIVGQVIAVGIFLTPGTIIRTLASPAWVLAVWALLGGMALCGALCYGALAARYPRLYCDTAVLTSVFRWRALPMLLRETALADRSIYASDWPFTSNALVFWNRLRPTTTLSLAAERNLFRRDAALKLAIGLLPAALRRGEDLLASQT